MNHQQKDKIKRIESLKAKYLDLKKSGLNEAQVLDEMHNYLMKNYMLGFNTREDYINTVILIAQ